MLVALLFGAIISPTDPISVLAIFKSLGTDEQLSSLIEAESLFNDGIAVVLFIIIQQLLLRSGVSVFDGGMAFIKTVLGGAIIGLLIGALASRITSNYDDHLLEIMLTTSCGLRSLSGRRTFSCIRCFRRGLSQSGGGKLWYDIME